MAQVGDDMPSFWTLLLGNSQGKRSVEAPQP